MTTRRELMTAAAIALALGPSVFCAEPAVTTRANPRTYVAPLIDLLQIPWPKNRTINIVCHGHSVPAGYFKTPIVDTFNAYPHLLHKGLKQRFPNAVINVIVTAIGGEASEAGEKRFERDVLCHQPDLITIDYALNDRRLGLDRAATAWQSMIRRAKSTKLILLTPTPDQSAKLNDPTDPLNQHADQIRHLATEHGLALADSLAAFKSRLQAGDALADLMSQSNHPNRKGHELVSDELLKWFTPAEQ